MRPDDERLRDGAAAGPVGRDADTIVPFDPTLSGGSDPELAALEAELERAAAVTWSSRAGDDRERPSPAFAASLRERLTAQLPSSPRGMTPSAATSAVAPARQAPRWGRVIRPDELARPVAVHAASATPRVTTRMPTVMPAPRWTAMAVAAALILAVVGFQGSIQGPAIALANVGDAAGTMLARAGALVPLAAGTVLRAGDEITVAVGGHADIELAAGVVRLAGGAALRIDGLEGGIVLEQLAGRAWHRVDVPAGTTYAVRTAGLEWTALGTAFDLARSAADGGERLELLAVEHDVRITGESLAATVAQGRRAVIDLHAGPPDLDTRPADAPLLRDPWLLTNARLDVALGFGVGVLTAMEPAPSAAPIVSLPPVASLTPATTASLPPVAQPTPTAAPAATPPPTPKPTPPPTPKPTPKPTPTPTDPPLGSLALSVAGCGGGLVLLDWPSYAGDGFDHYVVLRGASSTIPLAYPPQGGAVEVKESYTTDPAHSSAIDMWAAVGSTAWYRALAFDAEGRVIAATDVKSVAVKTTKNIGGLTVGALEGGTSFAWTPFAGPEWCFSYYKLVYSADDPTPSYLEGATTAWVGESPAAGSAWVEGLPPGTYWFRLQAIRATELGKVVVAETQPVSYTVPLP